MTVRLPADAGVDRDVDAIEVLVPLSVRPRIGNEVVDLSCLFRDDIIEARDDVAPATRQSRIERRHDAERRQIGRLQREVVDDGKAVDTSGGCRSRRPTSACPICC